jgi:hypothetical protein
VKRGKKKSFSNWGNGNTSPAPSSPVGLNGKTPRSIVSVRSKWLQNELRKGRTDFSEFEKTYGEIGGVEGWSAWDSVNMEKTYGKDWKNDPPQLGG